MVIAMLENIFMLRCKVVKQHTIFPTQMKYGQTANNISLVGGFSLYSKAGGWGWGGWGVHETC